MSFAAFCRFYILHAKDTYFSYFAFTFDSFFWNLWCWNRYGVGVPQSELSLVVVLVWCAVFLKSEPMYARISLVVAAALFFFGSITGNLHGYPP